MVIHWSVKHSLFSYITALDDGTVTCTAGAVGDLERGLKFPVTAATWRGLGTDGDVAAAGTATLNGHGIRMAEITEPRLEFADAHGQLSVRRWANREVRLAVAEFDVDDACADAGGSVFPTVRLLESGRELFDYRYDAGTSLDPVSLVFG